MLMIMKKIALLFAAISVLMSGTSCQKESRVAEQKVKVQIEVGDLEPGTKAIKSGWAEGDKINIWFGDAYWSEKVGDNLYTSVPPQLVLTRTASGWESSEVNESLLSDSGTFKAVYEASNSLFNNSITSRYAYFPSELGKAFNYNTGSNSDDGIARYMPLTCYAQNIAYEYDNTKKELTASINNWTALTQVQVVVTGLTGDPDQYVLTFDGKMRYFNCIVVDNNGAITINNGYGDCNGVGNAYNWALGIANPDGAAFYFGHHTYISPGDENRSNTVYLLDRNTSKVYSYYFTVPVSSISGFVFAVKIPFSKFAEYTDPTA